MLLIVRERHGVLTVTANVYQVSYTTVSMLCEISRGEDLNCKVWVYLNWLQFEIVA